MMTYANLLTDEQKEAFRKGDKYYVSPFKNMAVCCALCSIDIQKNRTYTTTTRARIHEARMDRMISKQWN